MVVCTNSIHEPAHETAVMPGVHAESGDEPLEPRRRGGCGMGWDEMSGEERRKGVVEYERGLLNLDCQGEMPTSVLLV
jgi:hypothetical protein